MLRHYRTVALLTSFPLTVALRASAADQGPQPPPQPPPQPERAEASTSPPASYDLATILKCGQTGSWGSPLAPCNAPALGIVGPGSADRASIPRPSLVNASVVWRNDGALPGEQTVRKTQELFFYGKTRVSQARLSGSALSAFAEANTASIDGSAAMLESLRNAASSISTSERLALAQVYGALYVDAYDQSRRELGVSAQGAVTLDDLQDAMRLNWGWRGAGLRRSSTRQSRGAIHAGVCRDIASAQGELLRSLGFPHTYVVSYPTMSGMYHAGTVAQDPGSRTLIHHLNYGDLTSVRGGPAMPRADFADVAMNYRLFHPSGNMVANIRTEFGRFLSEAAGFSAHDMEPLVRSPRGLAVADVRLGQQRRFAAGTGYGLDALGAQYIFGRAHFAAGPLQFGLVGGTQRKPAYQFAASAFPGDVSVGFLYAQMGLPYRFALLENEQGTDLLFGGNIWTMALGTMVRNGQYVGAAAGQGDLAVESGLTAQHRFGFLGLRASQRLAVLVSPGIRDVRNVYWRQIPRLGLNHLLSRTTVRIPLVPRHARGLSLSVTGLVLYNALGVRGRAEADLSLRAARSWNGATFAVQGPLTEDTAPYQPGTFREFDASVFTSIRAPWASSAMIRLSVGAHFSLPGDHLSGARRGVHVQIAAN